MRSTFSSLTGSRLTALARIFEVRYPPSGGGSGSFPAWTLIRASQRLAALKKVSEEAIVRLATADSLSASVKPHRKVWVSRRTLIYRRGPRFPSGADR